MWDGVLKYPVYYNRSISLWLKINGFIRFDYALCLKKWFVAVFNSKSSLAQVLIQDEIEWLS